jgi:hypothetical protein
VLYLSGGQVVRWINGSKVWFKGLQNKALNEKQKDLKNG